MEKPKSRFPNFAFLFVLNKYFLFIFIAVAFIVNGFFISPAFAATDIDTDITEDTVWTITGSPYLIKSDLLVPEGKTLTIGEGVIVKFDMGNSIYSFGEIKAQGSVANPIYFTSINDDIGESNDEDYLSCDYASYDEEGNPAEEEICETIDPNPSMGDWGGVNFFSSVDSNFNNVFFKYANEPLTLESSNINFENLNISDCNFGLTAHMNSQINISGGVINNANSDYFIMILDHSLAIFNGVNIVGDNSSASPLVVYQASSLTFNNSTIIGTGDGVQVFSDSSMTASDISLECENEGISVFSNSILSLSGGTISCLNKGIYVFSESSADINDVKISDAMEAGLMSHSNTNPNPITITKSEITGNNYGFLVFESAISAHENNIHDNLIGALTYPTYAEEGETPLIYNLDFTNNYWGDPFGPSHPSNPDGLGDAISDGILYSPFLTADPLIEKTGLSNILFIPGFQGSRIYRMVGSEEAGTEYEQKLWEPEINGDISDMLMNENGESIDKNVYTRDLISEASVFGVKTIDIYKSFVAKLDEMVSKDEIADWKAIPYDWRLSPLDIVNRGVEKENGNISYTEELTEDQLPYIIDQLQKLCDSSVTGDVSIVTHSNGGLVAESLIAKLIEMKNSGESDLVDHIDNLIMVAPPLLGTPASTVGLLHGYDQGMAQNILLGRKKAREFGQNVPGAYGLIPSKKYMSEVGNNLISLDSSLDKVNNWRTKYGDSIDTFDKFQSFLLDIEKSRLQPSYDDLVNPTILNETILNKANLLHNTIDNLEIPSSIKVSQVAGFGLPTVSSFQYKSKSECLLFGKFLCLKKKIVLSSDVGFTSGGDGTVVSASALLGEGEEYYLNLNAYNRKNKEGKLLYFNTNHSDIFEVPSLLDLINNIMRSDINLPEYITINKPSPVDYTVLKMRSPVAIDIYNEDGLHTGVEENEAPDLITIEDEIPNSYYMEIGEEKYIIVPSDDNYRLELTGLNDGIFTLEQQQLVDDLPGESVVFRDIPTTLLLRGEVDIINNNLATSISIDENNDGIFESNIKPTDLFLPEDLGNDIIKKSSSGSSVLESVLTFADQSTISINNFIEDSRIIVTESFIKKINQNNFNKATTMNITTPKVNEELIYPERNILSASAESAYEINPDRLKLQLIFVGLFVLLLLGLKFIFKLI